MEKQKITDKEKKKWKAMDLQELILWHNRFIRIIEGITAEYEWQEYSSLQDLPDREAEKSAEIYSENKQKLMFYGKRARYLGELLQLDPDADLIQYSPKTAYMVPKDDEVEVYERMTEGQLSRNYQKFMKIMIGIDELLDYYKKGFYINDQRKPESLIKMLYELRSYFTERLKLIVNTLETNP